MQYIKGDLIKLAKAGNFEVIAHGCNCMCKMGAGIAKTIKLEFPEAHTADCATEKGDKNKLGTCSFASCKFENGVCDVVNAYTQYHWRGRGVLVEYDAIRNCMRWLKENYSGKKIGLPKIGAGLAKGDWNIIELIIAEELNDEDITIVLFESNI
ncbi:MAG: macro domain-containing protein [Rivularia sp. (in: Bacteria)]|nr:macro domain-containing protein [Rivularia sp. MS3]